MDTRPLPLQFTLHAKWTLALDAFAQRFLLIADVLGMARSAAALINGYLNFDSRLRFAGAARPQKTRGESMLEEEAPCDRLPTEYGRVYRIFTLRELHLQQIN